MSYDFERDRGEVRRLRLVKGCGKSDDQCRHAVPDDAHDDIKALFGYWTAITPQGRLPGRQHFDPVNIPDLLPNIWLIDVHREPLRFWRRLVGSRIEEFAGKPLQGGWVGDRLDGDRLSCVRDHLTDVVETKRLSWRRGKSLIQYEKNYRVLERLYLPLAADGKTVDMVLAITVFPVTKQPACETAIKSPGHIDIAGFLVG